VGEREKTPHCYPGSALRHLLALLAVAAYAQTIDLPKTVKQGGVLKLHAPASAVSAQMAGRTVRLFSEPEGGAFGLMPIPADQKPGAYELTLLDANKAAIASANVTVIDAHFPKQNVVIEPSVAELKASPGESEDSGDFRKNVSEVRYWTEPLGLPVRGCMTSTYGVQRYLNGKPTGDIHGGLDQRSPAGAPIHAIAAGMVKLVRQWAVHGNTVAIDHGQGVESMYLHMSKFAVAEGATVKAGDVIGYVGSTGRSNAPHLHWTLYVNGVAVNPLEWVHVASCYASPKKKTGKR
jgi:murein DD-endopeptidase MepM/ murein hydrolase activator NlpD